MEMIITFGLLGLSIGSVWLPPIQFNKQFTIPPWILLLTAALASGFWADYLTLLAILEIGLFSIVAYLATRANASRLQQISFSTITAVFALALAMHALPGFNNPVLIANIQFSVNAAPFTQYANFDKAVAGLVLLVFFCRRVKSVSEWKDDLQRTYPMAVITIVGVVAIGIVINYIKLDLKCPSYTFIFLAVNLLFTCVAEEAFFRGFLQEKLANALSFVSFGSLLAALFSSVLFSAMHFLGGNITLLLATIAGLGYASVYSLVRRIEAPIVAHFALNTVHFIGFTYPYIQ